MNFSRGFFRHLLIIAVAQLMTWTTSLALAANQTWVAGYGSDSGTCTFATPCKTLAYALLNTASGGEISIDSTGELGPVTITKAVTINAVGALGSIATTTATNAITIAAGANDVVVLRGLTLNGMGVGLNAILFTSGARLHVESCAISGFTADGIAFQPSAASALFVNNVTLKSNGSPTGGGAAYVRPAAGGSATATFNHVKAEANARGIRADNGSRVVVRNSIVTGSFAANGFVTLSTAGGLVDYTIENSVSSMNASGGINAQGSNSTVRLSNVTVTGNNIGIMVSGGAKVISFGNNRVHGNLTGEGAPTYTLSPGQI